MNRSKWTSRLIAEAAEKKAALAAAQSPAKKKAAPDSDKTEIKPSVLEAKESVAVVAFGRMNPPTIGHEKLVLKMAAIAKQYGVRAKLFLSASQDPKSNPLSQAQKIAIAKKAFGKIVDIGTAADKVVTMFDIPKKYNGQVDKLVVVAGSDRVPEFQKKLAAYNGKDYNFKSIEVVSAGERDPDADGAEGMSASKARAAAAKGDLATFTQAMPTAVRRDAKTIMRQVRTGMNMNEDTVSETYTGKGNASTHQVGAKPLKEDERLDEAGPFSYSAKKQKPRKGTLAYEIAANRKAADKKLGQFKIKDDMVGNARFVRKDDVSEALTLQARMKRRMAMARLKAVLKAARRRALRKRADADTLERRARRRARDLIRQRILKTIDYQDLPLSARARVDAQVAKRKKAIARIAMKLLPKLRRAEMSRKLGTTARLPAAGGPTPTQNESVELRAIRNFLSESVSAPTAATLIKPTMVPAYEAWCMTRGVRMDSDMRKVIRESGVVGHVVGPGRRKGEWIVESAAGQMIVPEYMVDTDALVVASSHLRPTQD